MSTETQPLVAPKRPPAQTKRLQQSEQGLAEAEAALHSAEAKLKTAAQVHRETASQAAHCDRTWDMVKPDEREATKTKLREARAELDDATAVVDGARAHVEEAQAELEAVRRSVSQADLKRLREFLTPESHEAAMAPIYAELQAIGKRLVYLRHEAFQQVQVRSDAASEAAKAASTAGENAGVWLAHASGVELNCAQHLAAGMKAAIANGAAGGPTRAPRDLYRSFVRADKVSAYDFGTLPDPPPAAA